MYAMKRYEGLFQILQRKKMRRLSIMYHVTRFIQNLNMIFFHSDRFH